MLRLTNVILPLDHLEADLKAAILARLKIASQDLLGYVIFRRGYDARRKNAITLVYTLDVEVKNEAQVLTKLQGVPHVGIRCKRSNFAGSTLRLASSCFSNCSNLPPDMTQTW